MVLIALYAILYSSEPWFSNRFYWYPHLYFPVQTAIVITLSNLRPFLDFQTILYFPLCIQVFRTFPRRIAVTWTVFFGLLLGITLIRGLGLWEALALFLLNIAMGTFLLSYDFLYLRTQADQAESQRLLADLQSAHQKLQEQTAQTEELTAARERNRLARELGPAPKMQRMALRVLSFDCGTKIRGVYLHSRVSRTPRAGYAQNASQAWRS
jgi:signal transduction histidine kinase